MLLLLSSCSSALLVCFPLKVYRRLLGVSFKLLKNSSRLECHLEVLKINIDQADSISIGFYVYMGSDP